MYPGYSKENLNISWEETRGNHTGFSVYKPHHQKKKKEKQNYNFDTW